MEGNDDLELSDQDPGTGSTQSVRKNISIKLKPSPKGRGKAKKGTRGGSGSSSKKPSKKAAEPEDRDDAANKDDSVLHDEVLHLSVAAIKPNNSHEPLHKSQRLSWNHKVNLIGDKIVDPLIHCCEKCSLPILIYGRMIPCKHVFCFECARKNEKTKVCPRCLEPFQRIEQSALGTVFVCTFGGTKHGVSGCRRTYLSHRDLKAHIDHRHLKPLQGEQPRAAVIPEYKTHSGVVAMDVQQHVPPPPPPQPQPAMPPSQHGHHEAYLTRQAPAEDQRHIHHVPPPPPHAHHLPPPPPQPQHQSAPQPPHPQSHPPLPHASTLPPPKHHQPPHVASTVESYQTIPVMTTSRSGNLITIPIQDESRPYRSRHGEQPSQSQQPPAPPQQPQQPSMAYPPPPQGHQPPPAPYVPQAPPPQQYHTAHPPPPHSSGPPYTNPPPGPYTGSQHHNQQGVMPPMSHTHPPMSQPPPMTSSASMTLPSHHGPPPPHQPLPHQPQSAGPPPPRYSSSHPHYDEQHPRTPPYLSQGGHSPRTPWGNTQPRGPPPPRGPTPNSSMPPPRTDTGHYKQYYQ